MLDLNSIEIKSSSGSEKSSGFLFFIVSVLIISGLWLYKKYFDDESIGQTVINDAIEDIEQDETVEDKTEHDESSESIKKSNNPNIEK